MKNYRRRIKEKLEAYLDKHFEWSMNESPLIPEKVYIGRSEDDKGLTDYISNFFGEEVQLYICEMPLNDNLYMVSFAWVDDLGDLYADILPWSKEDWIFGIRDETF
jgi:hypothetical protein